MSKLSVSELENMITNCRSCWHKNLVVEDKSIPGRGAPTQIDVLFVGHTPSDADRETGKVFTGNTYSILTQAMTDLKIGSRECPIYMHNLVCCKPAGQKPKKEQIDNCSLFLAELMYIIQPNLIVTLGTDALSFILGKTSKIEDYEGEVLIQGRYIIIPLKHPNAIARIQDDERRQKAISKYKLQVAGVKRVNDRIKKLRASGKIPNKEQFVNEE